MGFSQGARNFVSVFLEEPPCYDAGSLAAIPQTKVGSLPVAVVPETALAIATGDAMFTWWLLMGDGFDVTARVVSGFVAPACAALGAAEPALHRIGQLLHASRAKATVFKKNAGRYVGSLKWRRLSHLTRRADLLLLASLGFSRNEAMEFLNYVAMVLSINVQAGEKAIPAEVRAQLSPCPELTDDDRQFLAEVDRALANHYGFTDEELDFIINYDIKYRMGGACDDDGAEG